MIETQIWRAPPECADAEFAPPARRQRTRGPRWRERLWAVLNAQALIRGATGGPDDLAFEDDRQRLARRGD